MSPINLEEAKLLKRKRMRDMGKAEREKKGNSSKELSELWSLKDLENKVT